MQRVFHDGERWSNAEADRVEITDYDPRWPLLFDEEAARIRDVLRGLGHYSIEHFGSTSIPAVAAKPIIDIMLIVPDVWLWQQLISPIESLGYVYWPENPRKDRMFFVKGMPPFGTHRTHHLHVRSPGDCESELVFRDYLRCHPEAASRYDALKRALAVRFPTDRDAYSNAKAKLVAEIVAEATASAGDAF